MDYNVRDVQFVQCSAFCNWYHPECEKYTDLRLLVWIISLVKISKTPKIYIKYRAPMIVLLLLYYYYIDFFLCVIDNKQ